MMISYNIYIFLSNRQGNIFRVWCSADIRVFSSSCLMKYSKIVSKKNRSAIEIDSSSGWSSTMSHWQWGGGCCLLSFERSIDTQWHSCWSDRSTSRSTPSSAVGVVCFLVCFFLLCFEKFSFLFRRIRLSDGVASRWAQPPLPTWLFPLRKYILGLLTFTGVVVGRGWPPSTSALFSLSNPPPPPSYHLPPSGYTLRYVWYRIFFCRSTDVRGRPSIGFFDSLL